MGKQPEKRLYNMGDPKLKQEADKRIGNLNRDAAEFATRGVTDEAANAFQELIDDFANEPTDEEFVGPLTQATINKDAAAEALKVLLRTVRNMADIRYQGRGLYNSFGFKGMDDMTDAQLVFLGRKVKRVGTSLLAELQGQGLTEAILTDIGTRTVDLDKTIDIQEDTIEVRDIATQRRVIKGNRLYQEYERLSNIGKSMFVDTDEARYNDYVIYDHPPAASPESPQS